MATGQQLGAIYEKVMEEATLEFAARFDTTVIVLQSKVVVLEGCGGLDSMHVDKDRFNYNFHSISVSAVTLFSVVLGDSVKEIYFSLHSTPDSEVSISN